MRVQTRQTAFDSTAPYPGLRPFDTEEHGIFFGRERQTDQLLDRLQRSRFLAIVGPSGCGKSSLVRAGLIAGLETGFMARAGSSWTILQLRPGMAPYARLAQQVSCASGQDPSRADFVEAALRRGPLGFVEVASETSLCRGACVLLLVDQFEELFRFREREGRDEADAFVAMLLASAGQTRVPIFVALTMRAEFLGECGVFHGLPERINDGQYFTPRLTREECAIAITGPARVFGGDIDPALVNQLLNDFGTEPDQLPILQHALMRMWTRRSIAAAGGEEDAKGARYCLSLQDYRSIGGLGAALSNHAEEALGELDDEQQRVARVIFQRLVERSAVNVNVRAPARVGELAAIAGCDVSTVTAVAGVFRRADRCFLTPRESESLTPNSLLDISHESLIRHWKRLSDWVEEESEAASEYMRLKDTARLWAQGRADLWSEVNLDRALAWQSRSNPSPAWAARYGSTEDFELSLRFLEQSRSLRTRQQLAQEAQRWRRLRRATRIALACGLALGITLLGSLLALYGWYFESASHFDSFVPTSKGPLGVRELTSEQVRHRAVTLNLVRRGFFGPVVHMEALDHAGHPTKFHGVRNAFDDANVPPKGDVAWNYTYDGEDKLSTETAVAANGRTLWRVIYQSSPNASETVAFLADPTNTQPADSAKPDDSTQPDDSAQPADSRRVLIQYSDMGYEAKLTWQDSSGGPRPGPDNAPGKKRTYDDEGRVLTDQSLGIDGQAINDTAGNSSITYQYSEPGYVIQGTSRDASGKVSATKNGWSIVRLEWDDSGNRVAQSYHDEKGSAVVARGAYHKVTFRYDARGNQVLAQFWDTALRPMMADNGCYALRQTFDEGIRPVRSVCLNQRLEAMPDKVGCAIHDFYYDWQSDTETMREPDGSECINGSGYSQVTVKHDEYQREIKRVYADANGPVFNAGEGYAQRELVRGRTGNPIEIRYLGSEGKTNPRRDQIVQIKRNFDTDRHMLDECYFGLEGAKVNYKGYHCAKHRYDSYGSRVETVYLDRDEQVVKGSEGYAGLRYQHDVLGNPIKVRYLNESQALKFTAKGVFGYKSTFDIARRETSRQYIGPRDSPATHADLDYSLVTYEYDAVGNIVDERYFDVSNRLAAPFTKDSSTSHITHIHRIFDVHSREIERTNFGLEDQATLSGAGVFGTKTRYDAKGDKIETAYYDTKWQPVDQAYEWHRITYAYDDRHRVVETEYFSADGSKYQRTLNRYDRYGNLVEQTSTARDGTTVEVVPGCYKLVRSYDDYQRKVAEECRGANGEPAERAEGYFAENLEYDLSGYGQRSYFRIDGQRLEKPLASARRE